MDNFDRERFGVLNKQTYEALANMAALREKHPGEQVIGRNDFVEPMHTLFEVQWENRAKERIFLLTQRTAKRVVGIDVKPLLGPVELFESVLRKDDQGYIVIPKESWNGKDDLSAYYIITDGKLYIHVCSGEHKVGYVVADKDYSPGIELLPWSLITMCYRHKFPHHEEMKPLEPLFEGLVEDFPELYNGDVSPMLELLGNRKRFEKFASGKHKSTPALQMHAFAHKQVEMAFKAFVFLKTADVYTEKYVPDSTPSFRRKKGFRPLNYIQVDSTWDKNIDVDSPFPVRGHFVHQPCKINGEWARKLIYVDTFMKKGYHRRAKKLIEEEKYEGEM